MDIRSAILAATTEKPFITRQLWQDELGPYAWRSAKILPTSSLDCCMITHFSREPVRGWQPSKADLIATDWITTALIRSKEQIADPQFS